MPASSPRRSPTCCLQAGHAVVGVDNLNDAYDPRLKRWRLAQLQAAAELPLPSGRHQRSAPPLSRCSPPRASEPPFAAVVNLAARAGVRPSVVNPWVYYQANCDGTLNLLEMCRRSGVRKFLLASTSSLYGRHNVAPYREDADTNRPLSPYAASKKAAETHRLRLPPSARDGHLDSPLLHGLRAGGPARHERVPLHPPHRRGRADHRVRRRLAEPRFHVRRRHRPGHHRRAPSVGLRSDQPRRRPGGAALAVIDEIARLLGKKPEIEYRPAHPADVPSTRADVSKAARLLDWRPEIGIEEGLRRSVEWYFANREMARSLELCDRTE